MKSSKVITFFSNPSPPSISSNSAILCQPKCFKSTTAALLHHNTHSFTNQNPDLCTKPTFLNHRTDLNWYRKPCVSEDHCSWLLSYCNSKSIKHGICVHSLVIKLGLQDDLFLNNNLLSLYSKCFGVDQARQLFDEMPQRDVVSWTGIVSAYTKKGKDGEALALFDQMVVSGTVPNEFTFSSVLRSCSSIMAFERGIHAHAQIIKRGFKSNPVLGSALIDFYSKCERFAEALDVFAATDHHDTIFWTTMISACTRSKNWHKVFELYFQMLESGIPPNDFTFVNLLMASGFLGADHGELVHAHVILLGINLRTNLVLKTALIDMYSKCSMMDDAVKIMHQSPESDVFMWTAIISGHTQNADFDRVVSTFREMELAEIFPNSFTFAGILKACSSIPAPDLGTQIHSRVIKAGFRFDVAVGNALVDMYTKCSSMIKEASDAFREIASPDIVSWASLIAGFSQHGCRREAFQAFADMQAAGIRPNSFAFSGILKACCFVSSIEEARQLHPCILKTEFASNIAVGNSLVDVYAKHGMMDDAWHVMCMMTHRDVITYTSLATGFNQMGDHENCLKIITHMNKDDDVEMDGFIMASFLCAAASLAAMETGRQLHSLSIKSGVNRWISVGNSLVDMYMKCGGVADAEKAFSLIPDRNVVSWNGMIAGLASNGRFSAALSGLEEMRLDGIRPDNVTFLLVLYACSHSGLVDLGLWYFDSMTEIYHISPEIDHYVCLVDLLGRAGRLHDAAGVIETMPFRPDALIYKTLLGSCKAYADLAMGEYAAGRALELDALDPAIYVALSNMYDNAGKLDSGEQIRRKMREMGLRKSPGQSWIEVKGKVRCFMAGDRLNPQIDEIHEKLKYLRCEMMREKQLGGLDYDCYYHSEKLAVGFGLLNTASTAPIRIMKNLRICGDCHEFIRLVTQLVDREIVVRDGNRFHSFRQGDCSCRGYW